MSTPMDSKMSRAYGCMIGLMCGDAAGATLEFYRGHITENVVQNAMKMPGGGQLHVGKGQVTDDSELALSLAFALFDKHPQDGFPLEDVAKMYVKWFTSHPFDMGSTCARAFSTKSKPNMSLASSMMRSAAQSIVSEANGALMRVAPLALWTHTESDTIIAQYAKLDAMLSHPSQVCQDCNAVYCVAIAYLLKHPGDNVGAISHLDDYVNNHVQSQIVKDWYFKESLNIDNLDAKTHIGHVKWGFTMAMHFLRKGESYESGVFKTLMKGGDTDTNAAIVGGMLGALHGVDEIPEYMKQPVLAFDVANPGEGYVRPSMFNSNNVQSIVHYLLTHKQVLAHKDRLRV